MRVNEIMEHEVRTCRAEDSLSVAAAHFVRNDCRCVPVVDQAGGSAGVVTCTDLCNAIAYGLSPAETRVSAVMTRSVITLNADDPVETAHRLMARHRVRHFPVLDADHHVIGAISLDDLAREAERERRLDGDAHRSDMVARTLAATFPRPVIA